MENPLAELTAAFTGYNEKVDTILQRMDSIERKQREPELQALGNKFMNSPVKNAMAGNKARATFIRSGNDMELKALSESSDPDGGYMVLPVLAPTMISKIFDQSAIARLARLETITVGDAWEEIVDFDEAGATWVGESDARPKTTSPKVGKLNVQVREIYANLPITQRLLDDSHFDLGSFVQGKIGDKFGRTQGDAFINGDGILKPKGFLTGNIVLTKDATRAFGDLQYFKTTAAATFAGTNPGDVLMDIVYGLRAPYKQGDGVAWVMNSTTAGTVRKFKTSVGEYLWEESVQAGAPPTLLGYPVELDEYMPDLGANTFPIAFGNWKKAYLIVEKAGIRMLRDPFTDKPNVLFYAYRRVGGGLANSEAIKLLKCEV